MDKFDEKIQALLKEKKLDIEVEQMDKVSKKSIQFWKRMKMETIKSNKINSKAYQLKMDIVHFEVYLGETTQKQLMYSIFDTKEGKIFVYDNMNDEFYDVTELEENKYGCQ
ncbi:MAG: hypothetical protein K6E20_03735 [Acholeplasmatales bacterium]|nr:hypothetical protein [Acholeplasmatales bacterium]